MNQKIFSMVGVGFLAGVVFALGARTAHASDDWPEQGDLALQQLENKDLATRAPIAPLEAFLRTQSVFDHYDVPAEPDASAFLENYAGLQSAQNIQTILKAMDPSGQFPRFFSSSASAVAAFMDRDSKTQQDFSVALAPQGRTFERGSELESRLRAAAANPPEQALQGLRIALDPGHMGGELWDNRTGKFVHDGAGNRLSEGIMALQVAHLLEDEFTALGAKVMITHPLPGPVTTVDYDTFDIMPYAREELRADSLAPWFQSLLATAPSGPELNAAFDSNPQVRQIFSDRSRAKYFIRGADLDARAQAISAFAPDITLIIHFDTSDPPNDPTGLNLRGHDGTKAYLVGSFLPEEFATRNQRKDFSWHFLDQPAWDASYRLTRAVVQSIHANLGVPFDTSGGSPATFRMEPGVYARNLRLSREIGGHAVSYVECLYYNDPHEFRLLRQFDHSMSLGGIDYPYSDRLVQVAAGLKSAVLGFVAGYRNLP